MVQGGETPTTQGRGPGPAVAVVIGAALSPIVQALAGPVLVPTPSAPVGSPGFAVPTRNGDDVRIGLLRTAVVRLPPVAAAGRFAAAPRCAR